MTDTQDISNDLSAWIDGELSDARSKQVAEAVQADPDLATEADELRQVASLISQFAPPELPDDFAQRIVEQAIQPKPNHFPHWACFCVAASVLITTGIALLLFEDGKVPPSSLAYHSAEDAESDTRTVFETKGTAVDEGELKTEADAIALRRRKPSSDFFGKAGVNGKIDVAEELLAKRSSHSHALKASKDLGDMAQINPAEPATPVAGISEGRDKGYKKLAEIVADDATSDSPRISAPAERIGKSGKKDGDSRGVSAKGGALFDRGSVATKSEAARRMSRKPVGHERVQAKGKGSRMKSRAGPGRYDVASNVVQARTEAQATITEMQNSLPVRQTVPGGPPGQKAIRIHAFQMRQRTQPENLEQTETVYAKSLKVGQQRIEGILRYNNIELVEQNQPLLNAGQAVAVSENTAALPATQQLQSNSPRNQIDGKIAAPAAQVQYMVFGGKSQIATLRSQVRVLNSSLVMDKANEVASLEAKSSKQKNTFSSLIPKDSEQVQTPTQAASQAERPAKPSPPAPITKPARASQTGTCSQISTPAVDILIITVEERK